MPGSNTRRTAAHCPGCGYALNGLRTRRCPECGVLAHLDAQQTTPGSPLPRFAIVILFITATLPPFLAAVFFLLRQVRQDDDWILKWIIFSGVALSTNVFAVAFASWTLTRLKLQDPGRPFARHGRPRFMRSAELIGLTSFGCTFLLAVLWIWLGR